MNNILDLIPIIKVSRRSPIFFPEFKTLELIPETKIIRIAETSIFVPFSLPVFVSIFTTLASPSCMNIQYSPRQDGCAYSLAS